MILSGQTIGDDLVTHPGARRRRCWNAEPGGDGIC